MNRSAGRRLWPPIHIQTGSVGLIVSPIGPAAGTR
jgi:hypothetical protein